MHSARPVPKAMARLLKEGDLRCGVCSLAIFRLLLLAVEAGVSKPGGGGVKLVRLGDELVVLLLPST